MLQPSQFSANVLLYFKCFQYPENCYTGKHWDKWEHFFTQCKQPKHYRKNNRAQFFRLRANGSINAIVDIYLFKVNNRNTKERCEICSKLATKTPEQCKELFCENSQHFKAINYFRKKALDVVQYFRKKAPGVALLNIFHTLFQCVYFSL